MSSAEELLTAVKEAFAQKESFVQKPSIVDFIPDILKLFLVDKMSREYFSHCYIKLLNKRKLCLVLMPDEDKKEHLKIERREFVFAYALNKLALKCADFDDEAFMQEIQTCMKNYLNDSD